MPERDTSYRNAQIQPVSSIEITIKDSPDYQKAKALYGDAVKALLGEEVDFSENGGASQSGVHVYVRGGAEDSMEVKFA